MNSASPGSPTWKTVSPRRNRRTRIPLDEIRQALGVETGEQRHARQGIAHRPDVHHQAGSYRAGPRESSGLARFSAVRPAVHRALSTDGQAASSRFDSTRCAAAVRPSAHADSVRDRSVRLTVVGSGTSQPQPETPASGLLVETDTTAILDRLRPGHHPRADGDPRSARARRDRDRPHARRPLHRPRLAALPPAVGGRRRGPHSGPPAARRQGPARRAGHRDQRAAALLRRCVQRPRVRPRPPDPHRRPDDRLRPGPALRPGVGLLDHGPDGARIAISGDTGPERHVRRGRSRRRPRRRRGDPRGFRIRRPAARPPDRRGGDRHGRPGRGEQGRPRPLPGRAPGADRSGLRRPPGRDGRPARAVGRGRPPGAVGHGSGRRGGRARGRSPSDGLLGARIN